MPRRTELNEQKKTHFPINPSTLETIDFALFKHIDETMNLFCDTNKGFKKTPVLFSTQERAHMIKDSVDLRDKQSTLIYPMISVERTSISKDPANRGIYWASLPRNPDAKGGTIQIARRVQQEKTRDRANADSQSKADGATYKTGPSENAKIVYETISIPQPVYLDMEYTIGITTEYVQQMNELVAPFMARTGAQHSFIIRHEGNKYEAFIQPSFTQENNASSLGQEERIFTTTLTIKVLGYIIGEDKNQEQPFIVVRESAAEVRFQRERAITQDELDYHVKKKTSSNPDVFEVVGKKNKINP